MDLINGTILNLLINDVQFLVVAASLLVAGTLFLLPSFYLPFVMLSIPNIVHHKQVNRSNLTQYLISFSNPQLIALTPRRLVLLLLSLNTLAQAVTRTFRRSTRRLWNGIAFLLTACVSLDTQWWSSFGEFNWDRFTMQIANWSSNEKWNEKLIVLNWMNW